MENPKFMKVSRIENINLEKEYKNIKNSSFCFLKKFSKVLKNPIRQIFNSKKVISSFVWAFLMQSNNAENFVKGIRNGIIINRALGVEETNRAGVLVNNGSLYFSLNVGASPEVADLALGSLNLATNTINFYRNITLGGLGKFIGQQGLLLKNNSLYNLIFTQRPFNTDDEETIISKTSIDGEKTESLRILNPANIDTFPYSFDSFGEDKILIAISTGNNVLNLRPSLYNQTFVILDLFLNNPRAIFIDNNEDLFPRYIHHRFVNDSLFAVGSIVPLQLNANNPLVSLYNTSFHNIWSKIMFSGKNFGNRWFALKVLPLDNVIVVTGGVYNTSIAIRKTWFSIFDYSGNLKYFGISSLNTTVLDVTENTYGNILVSANRQPMDGPNPNGNVFTLFNQDGFILQEGTLLNRSKMISASSKINDSFIFVGRGIRVQSLTPNERNVMFSKIDNNLTDCINSDSMLWTNFTDSIILTDVNFTFNNFTNYQYVNETLLNTPLAGILESDCTLPPTMFPTLPPTNPPTLSPTTASPTLPPTTASPTLSPTTASPTLPPTNSPTLSPTTASPTLSPTLAPTNFPSFPTFSPTKNPTEKKNKCSCLWWLLLLLLILPCLFCLVCWCVGALGQARGYLDVADNDTVLFAQDTTLNNL